LGQAAPQRGLTELELPTESIMIAPWPQADTAHQDPAIEARFALFQEVLAGLREVRSRQNIPPKTPIHFSVRCEADRAALLRPMESYFEAMAGAKATAWGAQVKAPPTSASFIVSGIEVFVDLADHIDVDAEIDRKTKEVAKLDGAIEGKERQLANANFVTRAPADVIEKERAALANLRQQRGATQAALAMLQTSRK
jgi:valyl-tRNA synthetase